MRSRFLRVAVLTLLWITVPAGRLWATPQQSKVGDTRVTFSKQGVVLRKEMDAVSAAVATLPAKTSVSLLEVQLPWIRVNATVASVAVTGWIRAYETVEPAALEAAAAPAHLTAPPAGPVNEKDAAAAGRQLDSNTERDYRATRADLDKAYAAVDAMETATQQMDAADEIGFIMDGSIGRRGRDALRPKRIPLEQAGQYDPDPEETTQAGGGGGGGPLGGFGRALGGKVLGKVLGNKLGIDGRIIDGIAHFVGAKGAYLKTVQKEFSPMTEYRLGRAVAANAIAKYGIDPNEARRAYVRRVGDAVVRVTDRLPDNYGGYHFDVLDTDEVNGVSGPGGFVLVTRGAVLACKSEDELAGILAHEVGHIIRKDGERAMRETEQYKQRQSGLLEGVSAFAGIADSRFGGLLTQYFSGNVDHISNRALSHEYSRELEFGADHEGTYFLYDVFYDHTALRSFLFALALDPREQQRGGTHAAPDVRAQALDGYIAELGPLATKPGVAEFRVARFKASVGK